MTDIKALLDKIEFLEDKLIDRETRLKAMERAFFEKVVEVDRLKEKLESLEAKV